jgi:hypothetical protein
LQAGPADAINFKNPRYGGIRGSRESRNVYRASVSSGYLPQLRYRWSPAVNIRQFYQAFDYIRGHYHYDIMEMANKKIKSNPSEGGFIGARGERIRGNVKVAVSGTRRGSFLFPGGCRNGSAMKQLSSAERIRIKSAPAGSGQWVSPALPRRTGPFIHR